MRHYPMIMAALSLLFCTGNLLASPTGPPTAMESDRIEGVPHRLEAEKSDSVPVKGVVNKLIHYFSESNIDKTHEKRMDFNIIGGPHYSSDRGFGIGMVGAGLYRINRADSITPVSNVSLVADITTSGFWALGFRGNTFFPGSVFRLDYDVFIDITPKDHFWGIGYDMGRNDDNKTRFRSQEISFDINFMYQITHDFFVGTRVDFSNYRASRFQNEAIIGDLKTSFTNTGVGLFLLYDSRDSKTAPYHGLYLKAENIFFPRFMGNRPGFNRTALNADFYHPVWKGGILAYDLYAEYNDGDTPWAMLARLGSSRRMRGYYPGRYRDKGTIEVQAELRQKIWRRIGAVAWVGGGNVFSSPRRIDLGHTLPNYGVGLRWEFKHRVNVRLDYGIGKGEKSIVFNINEAF